MVAEIHVGDLGTIFEATITENGAPVDLSSATTKQIIFRKADGSYVAKTAALTTDGTDGKMQYAAEAGFLSVAGGWKWQPYVVFPSGAWYGNVQRFHAYPRLLPYPSESITPSASPVGLGTVAPAVVIG